MAARNSLRLQLLGWILVPLSVLLVVNAWISYANGRQTADLVQDATLLASARGIAEQIQRSDGVTEVLIPPSAIERFSSGDRDRVVYRVVGPTSELLAGYPDVPDPPIPSFSLEPQWFDGRFRGEPIRAVALGQLLAGEPTRRAGVIVGQTLRARDRMTRELWLHTLWQEVLMVALAALLALVGLRRGLAPMMRLREAVDTTDVRSLSHFDPSAVQTELRPIVTALNTAIRQIERQIEEKRRFLADAAHQLRTPLGLLRTQAAVGRQANSSAEKDEALAAVAVTAGDMSRLTNQLLTLARVEAEGERVSPEPVDFAATVKGVLTAAAEGPLAGGRDLGFEGPGQPVWVKGNRTLLAELAANLLDNALRYGSDGDSVTARVLQSGETVRLLITDTGPGIPSGERSRVFERFYRIPGTPIEGSGLGLAIVQAIAMAHGGTVTLRDGPDGKGLAVEVSLPAGTPPSG